MDFSLNHKTGICDSAGATPILQNPASEFGSFYHFPHLREETSCIHAVTQKRGSEPYAFSLALHTGEEPRAVIANRKKVLEVLVGERESYDMVVARQTHSDRVAVIQEKETRGWVCEEDAIADCDAMVTGQKGVILAILTADCVPILLYDPVYEVVAAVHAGWRGSASKIVAKTVACMKEEFGCDPSLILAGIGPAIGRCCYEVDKTVAKHFFDMPEAYEQHGERYRLDLPAVNRLQLLEAGVHEERIECSELCTGCHTEIFFSYRKEEGCSGRFMSLIGIKAEI
jgi:YfiH family protein